MELAALRPVLCGWAAGGQPGPQFGGQGDTVRLANVGKCRLPHDAGDRPSGKRGLIKTCVKAFKELPSSAW